MFNLNKFNTQKEIWDEPSVEDEEIITKFFNVYPRFWYNYSKREAKELEKMFREN